MPSASWAVGAVSTCSSVLLCSPFCIYTYTHLGVLEGMLSCSLVTLMHCGDSITFPCVEHAGRLY